MNLDLALILVIFATNIVVGVLVSVDILLAYKLMRQLKKGRDLPRNSHWSGIFRNTGAEYDPETN